ncbi:MULTISPECIES: terpene synthase family protein [Streptomycetaceae]|uniref:terpene synthase family protein n=1 Tax=Streptomycetaceae TaxID=2062 RepID=UPI0012FF8091|nr:terpene synthase family protein [Streptantibioticus cattleyicolor]MYS57603.1 hypothetical protein [Streptomyces sp. SID5468]
MAARVQRALETPGLCPYADDPYAVSLHDISERFRSCATPVRVRRFAHAHHAWLNGVTWQIANRAGGRMPGLDDYLTMRLHSAGGEPTYAMLEIVNAAEVPAHEMDSPAVTALTEMAICVDALDNDRHSLAKGAARRQTDQNVFTVLTHHHRLTEQQALHEGIALRDRVLVRFLDLREKVMPRAGRELRRYLTDLGHGIRGNTEWALRVPRYLSPRDATTAPGDVTAPETPPFTETPLAEGPPTHHLPTIGWWWDDLA